MSRQVLLKVKVQAEHDLVLVRQRTRQLGEQLGLDQNRRTRLATAVSEISRNAFQYAGAGTVEYLLERLPTARLLVRVQDSGPGIDALDAILGGRYHSTTGLGLGLAGARRLVDFFHIDTAPETGTAVLLGVELPRQLLNDQELVRHIDTLTRTPPGDPFGEVLQQNQELLQTQSELVETNRELEEAQAAKDRFLAMLAHELRNLLNALCSSLEVMERRPEEEVRERMEQVARLQVSHLGRLVEDLLDASRIVRGTMELQTQRLDVTTEVQSVVAAWRGQIEDSKIALYANVPEAPVWLPADPTRLAQILGNLISNAKKFTDPGGTIVVEVEQDVEHVVIRVCDDGCGLDVKGLSKVFEPFAQTAEAHKRMTGGLGLGLAIVKGLVEAHDGRIEATSPGVGKGMTVCVHLPLGDQVHTEEAAPQPAEPRSRKGFRLLLVDDHEPTIVSLSELLKLDGHTVETATNGSTALETAANFEPEVVLCDLGLPGMDGNEIARQLKHRSQARLIAVSGFVDKESRNIALAAGFEEVLAKPIDLDHLAKLLSEEPVPTL